jgi:hypothetical protein
MRAVRFIKSSKESLIGLYFKGNGERTGGEYYYPAAEVDTYRRKVAALVEAAQKFEEVGWTQRGWEDCLQRLKAAIAAVEGEGS